MPTDRTMDGFDQTELFLGKSESGNRTGFLYFDGAELQAVRDGDWKLRLPGLKSLRKWPELDRGSQEAELYNLRDDVREQINRVQEEPEVARRLMALAREVKVAKPAQGKHK